jgi:hypothetical protein
MSESLALEAARLADNAVTESKTGTRFGTWFKAVLESLVSTQGRRFENVDPLAYRYPPL